MTQETCPRSYAEKIWGTFELESATGKNSIREAFGHKRVIYFTKLAKLELIEIKLSQLIMAFQFP